MSRDTIDPIVVRYNGKTCIFRLEEDIITCEPQRNETRSIHSFYKSNNPSFRLNREQVIGAEKLGSFSIRVHFVIFKKKTLNNKNRVILKCTDMIEFGTPNVSRSIVKHIRSWALWRGDQPSKRALVIVNPIAGHGRTMKFTKKMIKPYLNDIFGYPFDLYRTEYKGHAAELIKKYESLDLVRAILIIGGDGTFNEVLQGFLTREDWDTYKQIPFISFPVGSGNGLCASLGLFDAPAALYALSKGSISNMDVASIIQDYHRYFCILGTMYGLIASLDIGTEFLRFLGGFRFSLGFLWELIRKKKYSVKFAYLPKLNDGTVEISSEMTDNSDKTPIVLKNEEDLMTRKEIFQIHEEEFKTIKFEDCLDQGPFSMVHYSQDMLQWYNSTDEDSKGPNGWILASNFETFILGVLNIPYIASDCLLAPEANVSDGNLHMISVPCKKNQSNISRLDLLKIFLSVSNGNHIKYESFQINQIRAFVMSPGRGSAHITIDGELVERAPLYVEVHPSVLKVFKFPEM